jgi:uncharacterized membrane protein YjfL (UPF0719 family)
MIRALITLAVVGFAGVIAISLIFSLLTPLVLWAVKIAVMLLVGYLILKLISPKTADEVRSKIRRVK